MKANIKYDSIIFDFDGVLINSVQIKNNAFVEIYEPYGRDVTKKIIEFNKLNGGLSRFEKFKYFHKNYLNKSIGPSEIATLNLKFSSLVEEEIKSQDLAIGSLKFLERYFNQIHFYIASATPNEELRRIVTAKCLNKYFLGVYGSPSDKIEIINKIVIEKNINTNKILMIGDSLHDYQAAKGAGINFLGFLGFSNSNPFSKNTITIKSFDDLMQMIM